MDKNMIRSLIRKVVVDMLEYPMDGGFDGEKFDALVKKVKVGSIYMTADPSISACLREEKDVKSEG